MSGSVQTIIVCKPSQILTSGGPCGEGYEQVAVQAYLFEVSQAADLEAALQPVDVATASTVFLAAFSAVVTCFFVSRVVGSVLNMIRR